MLPEPFLAHFNTVVVEFISNRFGSRRIVNFGDGRYGKGIQRTSEELMVSSKWSPIGDENR